MFQSTLSIQNGLHKIYQRILIQIPTAHLSGVTVQNLKAQINSRGSYLVAEVEVQNKKYSTPIIHLINHMTFEWSPHPSLTDKNEALAMNEMIREFKLNQVRIGKSILAQNQLLLTICESFFRKYYR